MEKELAYEKLDSLLIYFLELDDPAYRRAEDIISGFGYHSNKEFFESVYRLIEDGYIRTELVNNVVYYGSTLNGRIFHLEGGYKELLKLKSISNRDAYIRTLVLTYGTAAAGLYGVFEIIKWFFHHEHWKIFF